MISNSSQKFLSKALADAQMELSADRLEALSGFLDLLVQWNAKMNLTGANTAAQALTLCLDSIYLAGFLRSNFRALNPKTWDLGAGAGLPGIPLRIFWTDGYYTLVESRQKRALFLQTCLARLTLPKTTVFTGRVEAFLPGKKADLIVSRAFMPQALLLELVRQNLKPNGLVLLMSSQAWAGQPGWDLSAETDYEIGGKTHFLTLIGPV